MRLDINFSTNRAGLGTTFSKDIYINICYQSEKEYVIIQVEVYLNKLYDYLKNPIRNTYTLSTIVFEYFVTNKS
jgi:hypothetical protein